MKKEGKCVYCRKVTGVETTQNISMCKLCFGKWKSNRLRFDKFGRGRMAIISPKRDSLWFKIRS